jgi:hypothetical protein
MSAIVKYLIIFEKTGTGFSAYVPDLPGCIATGKTKNIVEKNILYRYGICNSPINCPITATLSAYVRMESRFIGGTKISLD